ncbi:tRNA (uridine(54)-C5)-methyltransferase TrmA [Mergibacter septicus]|uniref:tRNA (uridine(54)-C5)-methyltransferase TrmA n=1 Tax=Mergibacter septicus TaxID=221402 RepID=UPI001178F5B0|nr:tRNA (uridine(54)-C5)-methyltransferase TrmA [Mergibacter septicus]AWX13474.1 tRNA (uridine(54)-C5)-methyltransferase TrmA [Mergibacter septicus]
MSNISLLPVADYPLLLNKKVEELKQLLHPFNADWQLDIFESDPQYFRMRAEFRIWHDGDQLYHIMFDPGTKQRYRVDQFPIASQLINRAMQLLPNLLQQEQILSQKLFQIDYLSTLSDKLIISLLYHKKLTSEWQDKAEQLKAKLMALGFDLHLIGRASKQKICLEQDYIDEILPVGDKRYIYRQVENSFTQPNARVNCKMLQWALDCTRHSSGDLLELYCGNGNFSIALAQNFRQVLATEIAKPSVMAAQYNIAANQIENLQIIRMSAEEFTQAINGERQFNRLKGIDLTQYQCNTIFVDPPRAGLDQKTLAMVQGYQHILYISCNPHTLAENLVSLTQTHRIERAALFDQFPYTDHIESGVWLVRR